MFCLVFSPSLSLLVLLFLSVSFALLLVWARVSRSGTSKGSYRSGAVVVVPVLRVRRLRARFALEVLDLGHLRLRAARGSLLEEVGHVSDLRENK